MPIVPALIGGSSSYKIQYSMPPPTELERFLVRASSRIDRSPLKHPASILLPFGQGIDTSLLRHVESYTLNVALPGSTFVLEGWGNSLGRFVEDRLGWCRSVTLYASEHHLWCACMKKDACLQEITKDVLDLLVNDTYDARLFQEYLFCYLDACHSLLVNTLAVENGKYTYAA